MLNIQIFVDVMNKMKRDLNDQPVFNEGDGTPEQRAYVMANTIKHFGSDVAAGRHEDSETIPLWLTNDGLHTRTIELRYGELARLISQVSTAADELQDPKSFGDVR